MSKLYKDLKYDTDRVMQPGDPLTSPDGNNRVQVNDNGTASIITGTQYEFTLTVPEIQGASFRVRIGKSNSTADGYSKLILSITGIENAVADQYGGAGYSINGEYAGEIAVLMTDASFADVGQPLPDSSKRIPIFGGFYVNFYVRSLGRTSSWCDWSNLSSATETDEQTISTSGHKHTASDINYGQLAVTFGGTGKASHTINSVLIGGTTTTGALQNVASAKGAFYSNGANIKPQFGTLGVDMGGTGTTSFPQNAIVTGNATSSGAGDLTSVSTAAGALYATGANSKATFGTLPALYGGTGVNGSSQAINKVLASPASGSAGVISFRSLTVADLPTGTTSSTVALGNHTHSDYVSKSTTSNQNISGAITLVNTGNIMVLPTNSEVSAGIGVASGNDAYVYASQDGVGETDVNPTGFAHYHSDGTVTDLTFPLPAKSGVIATSVDIAGCAAVDHTHSTYVSKSGDTITGDLKLNGRFIQGVESGFNGGANTYSVAMGFKAIPAESNSGPLDDFTFVWQGKQSENTAYYSHGIGTFNINPEPATAGGDPTTGIWIGDKQLSDYVARYEEITYANLVSLKTNSHLIPGVTYRITDYATVTTQADTQSAGHAFDLLVVADDVNKLNENARAIQHAGDTYFTNCKLEAWKIKYCLDNDTSRFAWASSSGKGVIYEMEDEWGNKCAYDFKNIQFKRYAISAVTSTLYTGDALTNLQSFLIYSSNSNITMAESTTTTTTSSGNITSDYYGLSVTVDANTFNWAYTFENNSNSSKDMSLNGNAYGNVISPYYVSSKYTLNNIVLRGNSYQNVFDVMCHDITFKSMAYGNKFGRQCYKLRIGGGRENVFIGGIHDLTIGGSGIATFMQSIIGGGCHHITLGQRCFRFNIGPTSLNLSFSTYNNNITIGPGCSNIHFGSSTGSKSYYQHITIEPGNQYIYLNCTGTTSTSAYYQNVTIGKGVNTTSTWKTITDANTNQNYETTYQAENSLVIPV